MTAIESDPVERWDIPSPITTTFDFDYTGGRDQLLRLYDKGTRKQWVGSDRLDWSLEIDPMNPVGFPDEMHSLFGTPWWDKMTPARKAMRSGTWRPGGSASSCTASRGR